MLYGRAVADDIVHPKMERKQITVDPKLIRREGKLISMEMQRYCLIVVKYFTGILILAHVFSENKNQLSLIVIYIVNGLKGCLREASLANALLAMFVFLDKNDMYAYAQPPFVS